MTRSFSEKPHEEWLRRERLLHRQEKAAARRKIKSLAGQLYFDYSGKPRKDQNG